MPLFFLNRIDGYNNDMNGVDLEDQVQSVY